MWRWLPMPRPEQMRRLQDSPYVRWLAACAWMGLIFVLSAQSTFPVALGRWSQLRDIFGHLVAYGVLAVLWRNALRASGVRRAAVWAFAIAILYGISDEFHQSFVPGRHPDLFDLATDAVGATAGLLLARLRERRQLLVAASKLPPADG